MKHKKSKQENRPKRTGRKTVDLKTHMVEEFAKLDDEVKEHLLREWRNLKEKRQDEKEKFAEEVATALGWKMIGGRVHDRRGREIVGFEETEADS